MQPPTEIDPKRINFLPENERKEAYIRLNKLACQRIEPLQTDGSGKYMRRDYVKPIALSKNERSLWFHVSAQVRLNLNPRDLEALKHALTSSIPDSLRKQRGDASQCVDTSGMDLSDTRRAINDIVEYSASQAAANSTRIVGKRTIDSSSNGIDAQIVPRSDVDSRTIARPLAGAMRAADRVVDGPSRVGFDKNSFVIEDFQQAAKDAGNVTGGAVIPFVQAVGVFPQISSADPPSIKTLAHDIQVALYGLGFTKEMTESDELMPVWKGSLRQLGVLHTRSQVDNIRKWIGRVLAIKMASKSQ